MYKEFNFEEIPSHPKKKCRKENCETLKVKNACWGRNFFFSSAYKSNVTRGRQGLFWAFLNNVDG